MHQSNYDRLSTSLVRVIEADVARLQRESLAGYAVGTDDCLMTALTLHCTLDDVSVDPARLADPVEWREVHSQEVQTFTTEIAALYWATRNADRLEQQERFSEHVDAAFSALVDALLVCRKSGLFPDNTLLLVCSTDACEWSHNRMLESIQRLNSPGGVAAFERAYLLESYRAIGLRTRLPHVLPHDDDDEMTTKSNRCDHPDGACADEVFQRRRRAGDSMSGFQKVEKVVESVSVPGLALEMWFRRTAPLEFGVPPPEGSQAVWINATVDQTTTAVESIGALAALLRPLSPSLFSSDDVAAISRMASVLLVVGRVVTTNEIYSFLPELFDVRLDEISPRIEGGHLRFVGLRVALPQPTTIEFIDVNLADGSVVRRKLVDTRTER
jgi:hypothetical protein